MYEKYLKTFKNILNYLKTFKGKKEAMSGKNALILCL